MTIANRSMVLESGAGHVFVTADDNARASQVSRILVLALSL